jgi:putative transcriptional regulator
LTINHHLDDATIVSYASGSLGEAHSVVVAAHLSFCAQCRADVRAAEAIGGSVLAASDQSAVTDICRAATLASLDVTRAGPPVQRPTAQAAMPKSLQRLLDGKTLETVAWRKKAPGVAMFDLPLSKGARGSLKLLSIGPGMAMPDHGHGGEEITLILKGSYRDHMGEFKAGDVADLDGEIEHKPVVNSDGPCICLVAMEAPTRFKSLWVKLMQPFIGI